MLDSAWNSGPKTGMGIVPFGSSFPKLSDGSVAPSGLALKPRLSTPRFAIAHAPEKGMFGSMMTKSLRFSALNFAAIQPGRV